MDDMIMAQNLPAEFSTTHSTQTSLLNHIMHLDLLSDHPKSSIGCIKINCDAIWKQWFVSFGGWLHG
jgi:hypothetical protein